MLTELKRDVVGVGNSLMKHLCSALMQIYVEVVNFVFGCALNEVFETLGNEFS